MPIALMIVARLCVVLLLMSVTANGAEPAAGSAWPQFHGSGASGVAGEDLHTASAWDVPSGKNVLWKIHIAGLGLSSPVIWGDRVFITTAVSEKDLAAQDGKGQDLKVGLYGDPRSVGDEGVLLWKVLCFDRKTGKVLWEQTAHRGAAQVKRHPKSSHANPTVATDGKRLLAFFGSEGLYCYDMDGKLLWKKDFGLLDSGAYMGPEAQWGFASSPVLCEGKVIVQCDVQKAQKKSFVAVFDAADGREVWRTTRNDLPTWSTPAVVQDKKTGRTQVVCNGFAEMAGYDFATGKRLWTLGGGGDVPVPTPLYSPKHGLVFLTGAHGSNSPVIALRTDAAGDLKLPEDKEAGEHIAWSIRRGGNYMQTPVVAGDLLYCCRDNGLLTCFDAATGKEHFRQRLEGLGFTASPIAADGKIYFTAESGDVSVIKAAATFELVSVNPLGEPALATPAVSQGVLFFRTRSHLIAIGEVGK